MSADCPIHDDLMAETFAAQLAGLPETEAHEATLHGDRVVCTCGDFNCASLDYTACSFALHGGRYCKGDVRFPATHATACPSYSEATR